MIAFAFLSCPALLATTGLGWASMAQAEDEATAPKSAPVQPRTRSQVPAPNASPSSSHPPLSTPAPTTLRAETIAVEDQRLRPAEIYQDTPVETEVLDEEKLRDLPAINAIEALEAIPGLRLTSQVQGQRAAVRIDGLPPEFTELLVNGQRYAGENERAGDLGDLLFANVERIEILRGPQALRYTARAAGGVINVITKDPPRDGAAVDAMIANGDQEQVSGELTTGWGNARLGGNLVYDFNQIGGFETPDPTSQDPDDGLPSPFGEGSLYRTHDLYGTIAARPTDALELKTRLGYRIRDDGFALDGGPITSRREEQRWLFSQEARLAVGDASAVVAMLTSEADWLDTDVGRDYRLDDSFTRLQLSGEHFLELGPTTHALTLGVDASTFAIELEEGPPSDPDIQVDPGELQERIYRGGLFLVAESELASWLSSEIGIRREMHSRFYGAWLPQAAVLFTPWRGDEVRALKLRLSAGRAIRYPSLRELYQPPAFQNGYFLAGSRGLSAEKAWALRASVEATPVRWLSTTVTGFYSKTTDYIRAAYQGQDIQIDTVTIPPNPVLCPIDPVWCADQTTPVTGSVFQNTNLDDLRSYGIEARLALRPHELVEVQLGYTWNRSLVDDSNIKLPDDRLPNSPEHVANGAVTLTAPRVGTTWTARGQWRDRAVIERSGTGSSSFATGAESNTSFELDMRLRQPLEPWLGRKLELFADVQNVTDNRVVDSYVVRGRSFLIGLRGTFP
ncbi:MAG: TonB-dependent receptor [Myxococcota bacterium]